MIMQNDFSAKRIAWAAAVLFLLVFAPAQARNVDLSTVPDRATVQLTIYNSEDLTLVRETRTITFKQGVNPLQFSWANTLIDPSSVELRFPDDDDTLEVLDTTFPHERPQVLYWNVQSEEDREATIEISYFTSGITWTADYDAIVGAEEATMRLSSFVRVHNASGEDYENAQVRLVVGTINLVEKIAQLAQLPAGKVQELEESRIKTLRNRAARTMIAKGTLNLMAGAPDARVAEQAKEIIKEGLSEYFIYTIEGTETVPNGWSKRLRSFIAEAVPLKIEYRYRLRQYGDQLVRILSTSNDTDSELGSTPLPNGDVRIFRDNGSGGLSYLARQTINYVAIGDKIELNLGPDPDVLFELVTRNVYRDNIWLRLRGGRLYQRADEPGLRIDTDSQVAGWDEHTVYSQRIRNYSGRPISVEIRREYSGDVTFRSQLDALKHDFRTVEFRAELDSGEKAELLFEIIQRHEYNQKQQRVELESGPVRL